MRPDPDHDAPLDAAIAARLGSLPEAARDAVRDGVRRLSASIERLRAAGFDRPEADAEDLGR